MKNWSSVVVFMALAVGFAGCATRVTTEPKALSPVRWGETAKTEIGWVKLGISAETDASAPNEPQSGLTELSGIKLFLRNDGSMPVTVVDPRVTTDKGTDEQVAMIAVYNEPITGTIRQYRPEIAKPLTLAAGQTIWWTVDVSSILNDQHGVQTLVAEYNSTDSKLVVAPAQDSKPAETVGHIWTGACHSGTLTFDLGS